MKRASLAILFTIVAVACAGDDGVNSLVVTSGESAGDNCAAGGVRIDTGFDNNGDDVLDEDEITNTTFVCSGEDGTPGTDAVEYLVETSAEAAGANCPAGGTKIDVGPDTNGDGSLDMDEIADTQYLCTGEDGTNGNDGLQTLVTTTDLIPSFDCPEGGIQIDYGLDISDDGVLDSGEIDGTEQFCPGTCENAPAEVLENFFFYATEQTALLQAGILSITGSPGNVNVLQFNGLGVVGGSLDNALDGTETMTVSFDRPVIGVSFFVNYSGQGGTGALGEATIEAFDGAGQTLGTVNFDENGSKDVTGQFGGASISAFTISMRDSDELRVSSVTYTTCN